MPRNVSVRVEVHISGSLFGRVRFKPSELSASTWSEIVSTVRNAAEFAQRVNTENIPGYRTLPIPKEK